MMELSLAFLLYHKKTILSDMKYKQKLKMLVKGKLSSSTPCRENEVDILLSLLVMPHIPPSIFIYGLTGTGKSHTVKKLLQGLNYAHAYINCIEFYSPKLMFQHILHELFGTLTGMYQFNLVKDRRKLPPLLNIELKLLDNPEDSVLNSTFTCDNMMEFVADLKQNGSFEGIVKEPYVIILDNCENLRNMDATLLAAFLRLQEFTKLNLCVILVAGVPWDKFYSKVNCEVPIIVHFKQYLKDELLQLLMLDMSTETSLPADFHHAYLNLVLSVCGRYCCSLVELRHVARTIVRKLYDSAEELVPQAFTTKKLWVKIKPYLEASVNNLYMRAAGDDDSDLAQCDQKKLAVSLQLPYYTKYMLIAAYLASYNPAASDKRMFMKHHGKERKRLQKLKKNSAISRNLCHPDSFTSDRLLAIFYSIVEDKVGLSTALLAQISTLVKLRLLIQDNEDFLATTYKCAVSLDFVMAIGRNVDFNVLKYLHNKD